MFGKNSTPTWQGSSGDTTFIASECQVTGTITIKGNARIDGQVEGTIVATGDLVIGQGAVLNANIEAKTVSLAGEVRGDVKTTDTLELGSTGRLYGDICTKQLKIDQGARFAGTSKILNDEVKPEVNTLATKDRNEEKNKKR